MIRPYVSIIIPVYNAKKYLDRAVKSVLCQKFSDFELILVDDGSQDGSDLVCDEYSNADKIRVLHKRNGGISAARKDGVRMAKGKWISFVDADDWIENDFLWQLVNASNDNIDIVTGNYVIEKGADTIKKYNDGEMQTYESEAAIEQMFADKYFNWSGCGKLYRTELFDEEYFNLDAPKTYGEDTFMNWKLFQKARKVCFIPISGYHYCTNSGSVTQSGFKEGQFEYFDIWEEIAKWAIEKGNNSILKNLIVVMIWGTVNYLYHAEKQYEVYKDKIEKCLKLVNDLIQVDKDFYYDYMIANYISNKFTFVNVTYDEYLQRYVSLREEFRRCIAEYESVYIYGAGNVAKDIVESYDLLSYDFTGFVVTHNNTGIEFCENKAIFELKELDDKKKSVIFLLAMNKNNNEVVASHLCKMGKEFIDIGRYSFFY